MLAIREGKYTFPLYIEEEDNVIDIYIGNATRSKVPCIRIWMYNKTDIILEDLVYLPHCSVSEAQLQRGDASLAIMLQSVLKWLVNKYPFVKEIIFTDKSGFKSKEGLIMLAEKGVLTEGQTWYMKHFGAEPSEPKSNATFQLFKSVHEKYKDEILTLDKEIWLQNNLRMLYEKFPSINGKRLSGTTWKITKDTIESYDVNPVEVQIGGGRNRRNTSAYLKKVYLDNVNYELSTRLFVPDLK